MTTTDTPTTPQPKPWYRKKRHIAWMSVVTFIVAVGVFGEDPTPEPPPIQSAAAEEPAPPAEPDPVVEPENEVDAAEREYEEAVEAAQEQADSTRKRNYDDLTHREFRGLLRDPDGNTGRQVRVWGEVMQYDSHTGNDQMLAYVGGDRDPCEYDVCDYWTDGELALLVSDVADFSDLLEEDHIAAWVTLAGTFDYETAMSVESTVPVLTVQHIEALN